MANDPIDRADSGYEPVLVGPKPFSLDAVLECVDPAPDEETERFVEQIYADRRRSVENPNSE